MKRFSIFAAVVMLFAACTTDNTADIRIALPDSITVSAEEGSRVQLGQDDRTVWTAGDKVSVFFRSNTNESWSFTGVTGDRKGTVEPDRAVSVMPTSESVVMVYPYSADNTLSADGRSVEVTIPSLQTYSRDSYGLGANVMVASGKADDTFVLKSVGGLLQLQLLGDKSVATIELLAEGGDMLLLGGRASVDLTTLGLTLDSNNNDSYLMTLDCGSGGVALDTQTPTSFYFVLAPQTLPDGIGIIVTTTDGSKYVKTALKPITVERNRILPFAPVSIYSEDDMEPAPDGLYVRVTSPSYGTTTKFTERYTMNPALNAVTIPYAPREGMYEKFVALSAGDEVAVYHNQNGVSTRYGAQLYVYSGASPDAEAPIYRGELISGENAPAMPAVVTGLYHLVIDFNRDGALNLPVAVLSRTDWAFKTSSGNWQDFPMSMLQGASTGSISWGAAFERIGVGQMYFRYGGVDDIALDPSNSGIKFATVITDEINGGNYGSAFYHHAFDQSVVYLTWTLGAGGVRENFTYSIVGENEHALDPKSFSVGLTGTSVGDWSGVYGDAVCDLGKSAVTDSNSNAGRYVYKISGLTLAAGEFKLRNLYTYDYQIGPEHLALEGISYSASSAGNYRIDVAQAGVYDIEITIEFNGITSSMTRAVFTKVGDVSRNATVEELHKYIADNALADNASLAGFGRLVTAYVAATNATGNYYQKIALVDNTGRPLSGIVLYDSSLNSTSLQTGDEVTVDLSAATYKPYRNLPEVVVKSSAVTATGNSTVLHPAEITVSQARSMDYIGQYVCIRDLLPAKGGKWNDGSSSYNNITMNDTAGGSITCQVYKNTTFAQEEYSVKRGDLYGILEISNSYYNVLPQTLSDVSAFMPAVMIDDVVATTVKASDINSFDGSATITAHVELAATASVSIRMAGVAWKDVMAESYANENGSISGATLTTTISSLPVGEYIYHVYVVDSAGQVHTSEDYTFTIAKATAAGDYKFGWFELPVQTDKNNDGIEDANPDYYYSHTMRADAASIRNFSACYSRSKLHPVWVAAPMHECYTGNTKRTDAYQNDPQIPFDQSPKFNFAATNLTRGHMVGSAERNISVATNEQAFYYSNIGAQIQTGFNEGSGAWNNLESVVDNVVCADTLYQVIGVVFHDWKDRYGKTTTARSDFNTVGEFQIPTAWYKVLLRTKSGNSGKRVDQCTREELQCVAFVLGHYSNKGHKPSTSDMYTVSELESITGLTFFPNVPNAPKDTFKASDWGL